MTRCMSTSIDCQALQQDLQAVYRWAEDVNMIFNIDKFEVLRFWPGTAPKPSNSYLDPVGKIIGEKTNLGDLGVQVSSDLTFSTHIENVVAATTKMVGWVCSVQDKTKKCLEMRANIKSVRKIHEIFLCIFTYIWKFDIFSTYLNFDKNDFLVILKAKYQNVRA